MMGCNMAELDRSLLELIVRQSREGLFIASADGSILFVNDHFCTLSGYTREEILSLSTADLFRSPLPIPAEPDMMGNSVPFHLVGKSGRAIPIDLRLQLLDHRGAVVTLGSCLDPSPLVRAERRLETTEARYRALFEKSPVPMWEEDLSGVKAFIDRLHDRGIKDLGTHFEQHPEDVEQCVRRVRILNINQAALDLHHLPDKAIALKGLQETILPQDYPTFVAGIVALASGEESLVRDCTVSRMDGTPIDVIMSSFVLPSSHGDWSRVVLSMIDISQLKRLQRNLEDAQHLARIGSWELDLQTNDLWWSAETFRIFGIDRSLFGASYEAFLDSIHPGDREMVDRAFTAHIREDAPYNIRHRLLLRDPDGTEHIRYVEERCQTERDHLGRPLRSLGTVQDVTEEVLRRQKAERETRRLEHVQRLESLGVLAGGIAHDFNNLLTAILGHADLAREEAQAAPDTARHLEVIEEAAQKAAALCRQMLVYAGEATTETRPLDLSSLVAGMLDLLTVSISKKVVIETDLAPDLPPVQADPGQIQQVVMNLVINASEAIGDKPGRIRITTDLVEMDASAMGNLEGFATDPKPGPHVRLVVADDGCGMDADTLARIHDPFFTTKFTGRGLGLSAVQGIVKSHHGALGVTSTPGEGTIFTVVFPTAGVPEAPHPHEPEVMAAVVAGCILVVDDEKTIRDLASKTLTRAGHRVLTAVDGQDALARFRREAGHIDCVLLDLTMPGLGGIEVFRAMKELRPDIKVLLSSGYGESRVAMELGNEPTVGFLAKPYTGGALLAAVAGIMQPVR